MTGWSKYPFVRMLIPMALGIWFATVVVSFRLPFICVLLIMLCLFGVAVLTSVTLKTIRLNWLFGFIMGCYLFFGGYALT